MSLEHLSPRPWNDSGRSNHDDDSGVGGREQRIREQASAESIYPEDFDTVYQDAHPDHASDNSRASRNLFSEQNCFPNPQPSEVFDGLPQEIAENDTTPRDHPLYRSTCGPDGLYHCPWEGEDTGCNHKPEKLKCNFDKFVDSHLKPYRCKNLACENMRFSSTACLLRHEREAHAMHGHGEKPFLCTIEHCERSMPGLGFPRQWNLVDHMKRVHNKSPSPRSLNPRASRLRSSRITMRIQNPSTLDSPRWDDLPEQHSDAHTSDYDDNYGLKVSPGQKDFQDKTEELIELIRNVQNGDGGEALRSLRAAEECLKLLINAAMKTKAKFGEEAWKENLLRLR